jgi:hypothetical protein
MLTRLVDLGIPLGSLRLLEGRQTIPVTRVAPDGGKPTTVQGLR